MNIKETGKNFLNGINDSVNTNDTKSDESSIANVFGVAELNINSLIAAISRIMNSEIEEKQQFNSNTRNTPVNKDILSEKSNEDILNNNPSKDSDKNNDPADLNI